MFGVLLCSYGFWLISTLTRPANLSVSDRLSFMLFFCSFFGRKCRFSLKHNTLTTGWQGIPLNESGFRGGLRCWTQTPEALWNSWCLELLLRRWLRVQNICFAALPRTDCWSLQKSEIKSIYLHLFLFILRFVRQKKKNHPPTELWFYVQVRRFCAVLTWGGSLETHI